MTKNVYIGAARLLAIIGVSIFLGYVIGTGSAIVISESIEINGTGSLLTMSTLPQASDKASGEGAQSYMREIDVGKDGSSVLSVYYKLDGVPDRHNRYSVSGNNKEVGVQHSVALYNLKNIETENFIESDSGVFQTEFGMIGTGTLGGSVIVADGTHGVDLTRWFADGEFEYMSSVYEMGPPAGANDDWLSCSEISDDTWPMWIEDESNNIVLNAGGEDEGR